MIITVKRFDPSKDAAPYYTDYDVPYLSDYMTLLQGLVYIHENLEPLAFDYSCRGRLCGRCAMMMNGEPVLACVTLVEDGKSYTVEPLANMPVVKDLIVDKSKISSEISKSYRRARIKPLTIDDLQTYDMSVADELAAIQYCARCQLCTTGCPARQLDAEYIGPSHMLAYRKTKGRVLRKFEIRWFCGMRHRCLTPRRQRKRRRGLLRLQLEALHRTGNRSRPGRPRPP